MAMISSKRPDNRPEQDGPADKYEQYEDALFALLKQDPAAAVPEEARRRCLEAIDRAYRQREREEKRARRRAFARKACAWVGGAAAAILLTFTVALAASPSFRTGMYNLVVEAYEDFTSLWIETGNTSEELHPSVDNPVVFGNGKFALTWLPEGYHIVDEKTTDTTTSLFLAGESNEDIISVRVYFHDDFAATVDTEGADSVSDVEINGSTGLLIHKNNRIQVVWADLDYSQIYSVSVYQCTEDDSIAISNGLIRLS